MFHSINTVLIWHTVKLLLDVRIKYIHDNLDINYLNLERLLLV